MEEANLLVTYDPSHPGKAKEAVSSLLKEKDAEFVESDVGGVFLLHVKGIAKEVVKEMREECQKDPERFDYTFHWVPIEKWISSDLSEMENIMKEINEKIEDDERWRITISKRNYNKHETMELIEKLTAHIEKRKVDLKDPQKIIQVEIIGDHAGISLLASEEYLDVPKLRR